MDPSRFLNPDAWSGFGYELSVELHPTGDDSRLLGALRRLWAYPALEGPRRERKVGMQKLELTMDVIRPNPAFGYGTLALSAHNEVVCVSSIVREGEGSDWLNLSIPTGSLEEVFTVRYPLSDATNPWLEQVDRVLLTLAEWLYQTEPFELAVIGEEVSGLVHAAEITREDLAHGGLIIPDDLWHRLKPPIRALDLSGGLRYVPPSTGRPQ